jgi:hypothetical protein
MKSFDIQDILYALVKKTLGGTFLKFYAILRTYESKDNTINWATTIKGAIKNRKLILSHKKVDWQ